MTETIQCPSCGGTLTVSVDQEKVVCSFCGTEFAVHPGDAGVDLTVQAQPAPQVDLLRKKAEGTLSEVTDAAAQTADMSAADSSLTQEPLISSDASNSTDISATSAGMEETAPIPPNLDDVNLPWAGTIPSFAPSSSTADREDVTGEAQAYPPPPPFTDAVQDAGSAWQPPVAPYMPADTPPPMPRKNNTWLIVAIAVIVVICLACACIVGASLLFANSGGGGY